LSHAGHSQGGKEKEEECTCQATSKKDVISILPKIKNAVIQISRRGGENGARSKTFKKEKKEEITHPKPPSREKVRSLEKTRSCGRKTASGQPGSCDQKGFLGMKKGGEERERVWGGRNMCVNLACARGVWLLEVRYGRKRGKGIIGGKKEGR